MHPNIMRPGPRTTPEEVEHVLHDLNRAVPDAYRRFLETYNGGTPDPEGFVVQEHPERVFAVDLLYSVSEPIESSNIQWQDANRVEDLPGFLLPVGRTGTGDLICMDTEGEPGMMYFYDWVGEPGKRLYKLGQSFSEFMESLFPIED